MGPPSLLHTALLAVLVLSAVTGMYLFFQSAPNAELYVSPTPLRAIAASISN